MNAAAATHPMSADRLAVLVRAGGDPSWWNAERIGRKAFTILEILLVVVVMSLLASIALPKFEEVRESARVARAIGDLEALEVEINTYQIENHVYPAHLSEIGRTGMMDPWGNPYRYLRIAGEGGGVTGEARKDRFLVPLNSDYDLYSIGADESSETPLSAGASADDVIRANNGGFFGLGSDY